MEYRMSDRIDDNKIAIYGSVSESASVAEIRPTDAVAPVGLPSDERQLIESNLLQSNSADSFNSKNFRRKSSMSSPLSGTRRNSNADRQASFTTVGSSTLLQLPTSISLGGDGAVCRIDGQNMISSSNNRSSATGFIEGSVMGCTSDGVLGTTGGSRTSVGVFSPLIDPRSVAKALNFTERVSVCEAEGAVSFEDILQKRDTIGTGASTDEELEGKDSPARHLHSMGSADEGEPTNDEETAGSSGNCSTGSDSTNLDATDSVPPTDNISVATAGRVGIRRLPTRLSFMSGEGPLHASLESTPATGAHKTYGPQIKRSPMSSAAQTQPSLLPRSPPTSAPRHTDTTSLSYYQGCPSQDAIHLPPLLHSNPGDSTGLLTHRTHTITVTTSDCAGIWLEGTAQPYIEDRSSLRNFASLMPLASTQEERKSSNQSQSLSPPLSVAEPPLASGQIPVNAPPFSHIGSFHSSSNHHYHRPTIITTDGGPLDSTQFVGLTSLDSSSLMHSHSTASPLVPFNQSANNSESANNSGDAKDRGQQQTHIPVVGRPPGPSTRRKTELQGCVEVHSELLMSGSSVRPFRDDNGSSPFSQYSLNATLRAPTTAFVPIDFIPEQLAVQIPAVPAEGVDDSHPIVCPPPRPFSEGDSAENDAFEDPRALHSRAHSFSSLQMAVASAGNHRASWRKKSGSSKITFDKRRNSLDLDTTKLSAPHTSNSTLIGTTTRAVGGPTYVAPSTSHHSTRDNTNTTTTTTTSSEHSRIGPVVDCTYENVFLMGRPH